MTDCVSPNHFEDTIISAVILIAGNSLIASTIATLLCIWLASRQGIPYLVLLVAICAAAAEILMRRTRFGARLYAIGGNPEAARLSGIDLKRVIFWNFVIAGFGYGVTGVALTARVSGAIGGTRDCLSNLTRLQRPSLEVHRSRTVVGESWGRSLEPY